MPRLRTGARIELGAARLLLETGALLVDVRRREDPDAPLEGALRVAPDQIPEHLGRLPRGAPVVLACT